MLNLIVEWRRNSRINCLTRSKRLAGLRQSRIRSWILASSWLSRINSSLTFHRRALPCPNRIVLSKVRGKLRFSSRLVLKLKVSCRSTPWVIIIKIKPLCPRVKISNLTLILTLVKTMVKTTWKFLSHILVAYPKLRPRICRYPNSGTRIARFRVWVVCEVDKALWWRVVAVRWAFSMMT